MRTSTTQITTTLLVLLLIGPVGLSSAQNPSNVTVEPGYILDAAVTGLDFPTAIAFAEEETWISEAGHLPDVPPKIKSVDLGNGSTTTILSADELPEGVLLGPLTDVTHHDGWLWITHRQVGADGWHVGAISKFQPDDPAGTFMTVITNLPSSGDHHTNEIIFDESGQAFFVQGTATNSSVVGPDNYLITGWLQNFPDFYEFPAKDVVLNGQDVVTPVPFPLDPEADDITAPFQPFGSGPVAPGTVVPAATPESPQNGIIAGVGAVYSFDPSAADAASTLQLEAWGLRNPFGIGIDPFNPSLLFSTNNGADIRGTAGEASVPIDLEDLKILEPRPINGDYDDLFILEIGGEEEFFGWPDYFHHEETGEVLPVTDPMFCAELEDCPDFVLDEDFRNSLDVLPAFAQFELHSSANKFAFSTTEDFAFVGDLFVAETGSFVPITGATQFVGYRVVRVDRETSEVSDFIVNTGETAEEIFDPMSFNKPIDVKFKGQLMLIVDFGVFEPGLDIAQAGTGKVWQVFTAGPAEDTENPECAIVSVDPGPPTMLTVRTQDTGSGLSMIEVLKDQNATVSWPSFTAGTTDPVIVTATKVDQGQRATVALRVTDVAGNETTCDPVVTTATAEIPERFGLDQNFPNPFLRETAIPFSVAEPTPVVLEVYDVQGKRVATLIDQTMEAGTYEARWDGVSDAGVPVSGGVYLYRIRAGQYEETRIMTLLK